MLVKPKKALAAVRVDQADLASSLHQYRLATLVALARGAFTVQDLTLNVKLLVDGEEVFAEFEQVVTDKKGRAVRIVLYETTARATYWYILVSDTDEHFRPEQHRLFCKEDGNDYTLEANTYLANSE